MFPYIRLAAFSLSVSSFILLRLHNPLPPTHTPILSTICPPPSPSAAHAPLPLCTHILPSYSILLPGSPVYSPIPPFSPLSPIPHPFTYAPSLSPLPMPSVLQSLPTLSSSLHSLMPPHPLILSPSSSSPHSPIPLPFTPFPFIHALALPSPPCSGVRYLPVLKPCNLKSLAFDFGLSLRPLPRYLYV